MYNFNEEPVSERSEVSHREGCTATNERSQAEKRHDNATKKSKKQGSHSVTFIEIPLSMLDRTNRAIFNSGISSRDHEIHETHETGEKYVGQA
jgi:hypothetical protein